MLPVMNKVKQGVRRGGDPPRAVIFFSPRASYQCSADPQCLRLKNCVSLSLHRRQIKTKTQSEIRETDSTPLLKTSVWPPEASV